LFYSTRSNKFERLLACSRDTCASRLIDCKEYELSPAERKGVLALAEQCLFGQAARAIGKIKFIYASIKAKRGKPLGEQEMIQVKLTLADQRSGQHPRAILMQPVFDLSQ